MDEADRLGLHTTWTRELCQAVRDVAPEAHPDETFDVYLLAFGGDLDLGFMRGMTEDQFVRLRDAARAVFEVPAIETAHVREAVEATVWHWNN